MLISENNYRLWHYDDKMTRFYVAGNSIIPGDILGDIENILCILKFALEMIVGTANV